MNVSLVTVEAESTAEAAEQMRLMGYRKTGDLRWRAHGIKVDDLIRLGVAPTFCRFRRSGRVLQNSYYWTEAQEIEVARASIAWLKEGIAELERWAD